MVQNLLMLHYQEFIVHKVTLNKGAYSDVVAVLGGKDYSFGKIEVTTDTKDVTFSFDATTLMTFTDASNTPYRCK